MLIPAQKPDSVEAPAILRREAQPVSPALPVSGLPEQAQKADPRLAVQTVPPGFQGEATTGLRPAPGLGTLPGQATLPPGAAGPSAVLELSTTGDSLGQWLAKVIARQPLGVPMPWPQPDEAALTQAQKMAETQGHPAGPMRALWALYLGLARSEVFASSHLFKQFWPEQKPKPGDSGAAPNQVRRWVEALSPESQPATEAGRMLLGGPMQWQGELIPGWFIILRREDQWRPGASGADLEKAAALRVDLMVPDRGPLRIEAAQWGPQDLDIRLSWPADVHWPEPAWAQLQARLAQMGLTGLRLSRQPWNEDGRNPEKPL